MYIMSDTDQSISDSESSSYCSSYDDDYPSVNTYTFDELLQINIEWWNDKRIDHPLVNNYGGYTKEMILKDNPHSKDYLKELNKYVITYNFQDGSYKVINDISKVQYKSFFENGFALDILKPVYSSQRIYINFAANKEVTYKLFEKLKDNKVIGYKAINQNTNDILINKLYEKYLDKPYIPLTIYVQKTTRIIYYPSNLHPNDNEIQPNLLMFDDSDNVYYCEIFYKYFGTSSSDNYYLPPEYNKTNQDNSNDFIFNTLLDALK